MHAPPKNHFSIGNCIFSLHFLIHHLKKWLSPHFQENPIWHSGNLAYSTQLWNPRWLLQGKILEIQANYRIAITLECFRTRTLNLILFLFLISVVTPPNLEEIWNSGFHIPFFVLVLNGITLWWFESFACFLILKLNSCIVFFKGCPFHIH